ncbi:PucR family transcriptional regulator [Mycobacterium sp.]|uniref:PucR family transcriptional regulator n=1 Tax=Mycobacterium sp. TaxID=1785 RepID=UPI003D6C1739
MAVGSQHAGSVVSVDAVAVIARLSDRLTDVTQTIYEKLSTEISELRSDAQLLELMRSSVEGNVATIFHALQHEIPLDRVQPPTAALEYARRLAQHGVAANALVRAYRLGQQALLDLILLDIRESALPPGAGFDVFAELTKIVSGYIDWISQQVVAAYEAERDRWLENRNHLRAVRVREMLDATDVDIDSATAALGYPLRRTHLALVLWFPDDEDSGSELARLERTVSDLAESMNTQGAALFVAVDRVSGWAWIPLGPNGIEMAREGALAADIRRVIADHPEAPYLSVGTPLPGIAGFRRSHRQALSARRVAIAAGAPVRHVTAATDPGLSAAALLCDNVAEARAWVHETLGALAADTDNDARLRETLRTFLRHGNYKTAAEELNLHFNSVKYRVLRANERRGRPVTDDRLDVELALLICHWLGAAVFQPDHQ